MEPTLTGTERMRASACQGPALKTLRTIRINCIGPESRAMNPDDFARQFGALYRELYRLAVRRVEDGREVLAAETTALLLHLSQTGPATLSELTMHLDRAPSTLSVKVAELESRGLLSRQR